SIHHVALRTGRRVADFKPAACRHWPLVLEPDGTRVRVAVEPAARRMGCVAPAAELPGKPTVRDAFGTEIAELCGMVGGIRPRRSSRWSRSKVETQGCASARRTMPGVSLADASSRGR